jgi:hypothetical protein
MATLNTFRDLHVALETQKYQLVPKVAKHMTTAHAGEGTRQATAAASGIAHIGGLKRRNQARPNNNRGYYRTLLNTDLDASGERGPRRST